MYLDCPHCHAALAVPNSVRRYYDMPVRCYRCRHSFTVQRQTPHDDMEPAHDYRWPLDRSVSARQSHHLTLCHDCGAALGVPGYRQTGLHRTATPLSVACPYCLASFDYHWSGNATHLDWLIIGLLAGVATGCLVLWGHHEGYIELRNLGAATWLSEVRVMLARFTNHLGSIN